MPSIYRADEPIWFAEDIPAYHLYTRRPFRMTDEDYEMSKPNILIRSVTRQEAAVVIAGHLRGIASMRHITADGLSELYRSSADLLLAGAGAVQLGGRIFRVRRDNEA